MFVSCSVRSLDFVCYVYAENGEISLSILSKEIIIAPVNFILPKSKLISGYHCNTLYNLRVSFG